MRAQSGGVLIVVDIQGSLVRAGARCAALACAESQVPPPGLTRLMHSAARAAVFSPCAAPQSVSEASRPARLERNVLRNVHYGIDADPTSLAAQRRDGDG